MPRPKRVKPRKNANIIQFHRGHKIRLPNHPTEFCSQPWFPLIVRINNPTNSIKFGDLYNAFVSQLTGLSFGTSVLMVRLMSIRVWGPIPATNTALRMVVKDVFDDTLGTSVAGGQVVLEIIENYADQVNRARVGYVYSTAQQQKGLFCIAAATDDIIAVAGAGAGSVAYIQLLWRPNGGTVSGQDLSAAFNSISL